MFNLSQPEINVEELMQKIREDVARQNNQSKPSTFSHSNVDTSNNWNISLIEGFIRNAESRAIKRTKWPDNLNKFPYNFSQGLQKLALKILNFIFKDQREVNFNIINALKESVALNQYLIKQITTLRSQMDEFLGAVDKRLGAMDTRLEKLDKRLDAMDTRLQSLDQPLSAMDTRLQSLVEPLGAMDNRLQKLYEHLSNVDTHIQRLDKRLNLVNSNVQEVDDNFNKSFSQTNNSVISIKERLDTVNSRIQKLDDYSIRNESYLKNDLMQQKRLITLLLEEAKQRLPEPFSEQELKIIVKEKEHLLDALYVAFEDQFRGSQELIINRLKIYLPLISEAKVGTVETPILDVGCGRGEWLELLRESGYTARGLDINRVMLEECRLKELEVIEADVITYLQSLPDASLGGITGFHLIEHLPLEALIKLLMETARLLKPGGLVIFETPNPENIIVGSCNFYSDPTHKNPLFPPTVKFLMEQCGFENVDLLRLREFRIEDNLEFIEADNPLASKINPIIEIIKSRFYAAPDFAVIAKKAS